MTTSSESSVSEFRFIKEDGDYSFFPIKNQELYKFCEVLIRAHWTVFEISFKKDREDWDSLKDEERRFLTFILAFFAQFDGIVNENLLENFQRETSDVKEAKLFYILQNENELHHNMTYSVMIETFIRDPVEKEKAFNAIFNYPSIRKIALWMDKWFDPNIPLAKRIVAFACLEGIIFTGAFCAIYYIKKQGKLEGLCTANSFIAKDEGTHRDFAVALNKYYIKKKRYEPLMYRDFAPIIEECIDVASEFIQDALHVELINLRSDDMIEYIKCAGDDLAEEFGYAKIFNADNPFTWMVLIAMENKTNFFEKNVSEYKEPKLEEFVFNPKMIF